MIYVNYNEANNIEIIFIQPKNKQIITPRMQDPYPQSTHPLHTTNKKAEHTPHRAQINLKSRRKKPIP